MNWYDEESQRFFAASSLRSELRLILRFAQNDSDWFLNGLNRGLLRKLISCYNCSQGKCVTFWA